MASLRVPTRLAAHAPSLGSCSRPGLLYCRPLASALAQQQHNHRSMASKGDGPGNNNTKDDDLGGPGGQEPVDPAARARQNAGIRNRTILRAIIVGVPLCLMASGVRDKP